MTPEITSVNAGKYTLTLDGGKLTATSCGEPPKGIPSNTLIYQLVSQLLHLRNLKHNKGTNDHTTSADQ